MPKNSQHNSDRERFEEAIWTFFQNSLRNNNVMEMYPFGREIVFRRNRKGDYELEDIQNFHIVWQAALDIQITDEMVEAGVEVLCKHRFVSSPEIMVIEAFPAMLKAHKGGG